LELKDIYAPVGDELEAIKGTLKGIRQVKYAWLAEQLAHVVRGTGKVIRPALTLLAGKTFPSFEANRDYLRPMAVSVELMHTATLVHDDAIDKAATRRGQPTMNSIWGDEIAILMGDYLFAKAGEYVADTQSPRAIKLFSQTLGIISSGEIGQFRGAYNADQTREDYYHRIYSKTGSLFSLSTQTGSLLAGAAEPDIVVMKDYGDNLGIAFQIVDDILDFTSTPEVLGKPVGSDLRQGTLTLPAMFILERYPDDNPVRKYFQTRDDRYTRETVDLVLNSDIITESYTAAAGFRDRACRDLKSLPDTICRRSLEELGEYIINQGR
jgi:geranylgeranyl pyrophosphate synthase